MHWGDSTNRNIIFNVIAVGTVEVLKEAPKPSGVRLFGRKNNNAANDFKERLKNRFGNIKSS